MRFLKVRTNMVEQQVRPWHVLNEAVLSVMSQIPRETFVPHDYLNLAYSDTDIPLGDHQTMLSPKMVGNALQALALQGDEKVLEVGTGTGYITACLSKLAATVISVEIQPALSAQAEKNLSSLQCRNITLEQGDGSQGWEIYAPYDAIVVTGSYPLGVPKKICEQLHPKGGRLFAICGLAPAMQAVRIERQSKSYTTHILFETVVPALSNVPLPPKFQF